MIYNLQVLRAIAAILVVWAHVKELLPEGTLPRHTPSGLAGVDLFFVISGFVMIYTTRRGDIGPFDFFLKRILRVAPIYYVFVLITIVISLALPSLLKSTTLSAAMIVKTLLFIPFEKSPGRLYPIYYVGWTLNYEMFFYAIFAIAIALSRRHRYLISALTVLGLVLVGTLIDSPRSGTIFYAFTRPIMLDFLAGMTIGHFYGLVPASETEPPLGWWAVLAAGAIGLVVIPVLLPPGLTTAPNTHTFLTYGIPSALIVLSAIGLEKSERQVRNRVMLKLGDASYSLYLLHFFIIAAAIAAANRLGLGLPLRIVLGIALFPIVSAMAIIFYQLIEKPITVRLRRFETLPPARP